MMRKVICTLLVISMLLCYAPASLATVINTLDIKVVGGEIHTVSILEENGIHYVKASDLSKMFGEDLEYDDELNSYIISGACTIKLYVNTKTKTVTRAETLSTQDDMHASKTPLVDEVKNLKFIINNKELYVELLDSLAFLGGLLFQQNTSDLYLIVAQSTYNELYYAVSETFREWGSSDARIFYRDEDWEGMEEFGDNTFAIFDCLVDMFLNKNILKIGIEGSDSYFEDWQRAILINTLSRDIGSTVQAAEKKWKNVSNIVDIVDGALWEPELNEYLLFVFDGNYSALAKIDEAMDLKVASGVFNVGSAAMSYTLELMKIGALNQEGLEIVKRIFVDNYDATKSKYLKELTEEIYDKERAQRELLVDTLVDVSLDVWTDAGENFVLGSITYAGTELSSGRILGTTKALEIALKITLHSIEAITDYDFGTEVELREISNLQQIIRNSAIRYLRYEMKYGKNLEETAIARSTHLRDCGMLYAMLYEQAFMDFSKDTMAYNANLDSLCAINVSDTILSLPGVVKEKCKVTEKDIANILQGDTGSTSEIPDEPTIQQDITQLFKTISSQSMATYLKSQMEYDYNAENSTKENASNIPEMVSIWYYGTTVDLDGDGIFEVICGFKPNYISNRGYDDMDKMLEDYYTYANLDVHMVISANDDIVYTVTNQQQGGYYRFVKNKADNKIYLMHRSGGVGKLLTFYEWKVGCFFECLFCELGMETDEAAAFINNIQELNMNPHMNDNPVTEKLYMDVSGEPDKVVGEYIRFLKDLGVYETHAEGTLSDGRRAIAIFTMNTSNTINKREYEGYISGERYKEVAGTQVHYPMIYKPKDTHVLKGNVTNIIIAAISKDNKSVRFYSVDTNGQTYFTSEISEIELKSGILTITIDGFFGIQSEINELILYKENLYMLEQGQAPTTLNP